MYWGIRIFEPGGAKRRTGPYTQQLWYFKRPKKLESGEYDCRLPLDDGLMPSRSSTYRLITEVTGKPARAMKLTIKNWFNETRPSESAQPRIRSTEAPAEDPSSLSLYDNFAAWRRIYRLPGGEQGPST
ncbi:hypothetical protein GQ53DRAFT_757294 [Thozetella sp. PMI_491]|nr:hypothetical protein GQ53DRAFT_757294 [Thozetella sp. PMI_491]